MSTDLDPPEIAESEVRIRIPSFWTQPVGTDAAGEDPPGEVNFTENTIYGSVSGRDIVINVPKAIIDASTTYTATYTGVTAPHRADTYGFPLTNATHDVVVDGTVDPNANQVEVTVGPVNSGAGDRRFEVDRGYALPASRRRCCFTERRRGLPQQVYRV